MGRRRGALLHGFTGRYGRAGVSPDPLSGVFLIPLGLPWNLLIDAALEAAWPWLALAAPAMNVANLLVLRRWARRPR